MTTKGERLNEGTIGANGVMAELEVILRGAVATTPVDVRRRGCVTCNNHSVSKTRTGDLYCRRQKHDEYFDYSYAPMRIGGFLKLINVYIWIGILFSSFHLGATMNNTTDATNSTLMTDATTIIISTIEVSEITTVLLTTPVSEDEGWIIGVAVAGGLILIAGIVVIVIVARKKCKCCSHPPSPVSKDFNSPNEGRMDDRQYNAGYADNTQGDVAIGMESVGPAVIDEPLYQNTPIGVQAQENAGFHSPVPEDFPVLPVPLPPINGASNQSSHPALGIPSPFMLPQPDAGPALSSPNDDFPDRPPPAVPQGAKSEDYDKSRDAPEKSKKKDKKKKKEDKPKAPQRFIDPNEQIREKVPMLRTTKPSSLDACRPRDAIPAKFDFSKTALNPDTGDDFGGTYEDMSPVDHSPIKGRSPRQPENDDFGGVYEEMDNGCDDGDYDGEYEDMDPSSPPQRPTVQARRLDMNQRQMVLPPVKSGEEDFGAEYEVVSPKEPSKHYLPGVNIDHRPRIPIPVQEQQDFGGEYENPDQKPRVLKKMKPPVTKPKTTKKPSIPPPQDTDFGQEYGNTGPSKSFPSSATHRAMPSLPSSSSLPDTQSVLPKDDDQGLPPPPQDIYDDTDVRPTIAKKPLLKPVLSPKPSSGGSSSTLPYSHSNQPIPLESRSSASLPTGTELIEEIEENVYENFQAPPDVKEKITRHYHNLPTPEKKQEQINSSGYSVFSERPKQY